MKKYQFISMMLVLIAIAIFVLCICLTKQALTPEQVDHVSSYMSLGLATLASGIFVGVISLFVDK